MLSYNKTEGSVALWQWTSERVSGTPLKQSSLPPGNVVPASCVTGKHFFRQSTMSWPYPDPTAGYLSALLIRFSPENELSFAVPCPLLAAKNCEQPKGCLLKSICWSWFDMQQQLLHSFRKTEVLYLLWTCSPDYKHSWAEILSVVSGIVASSLWWVVGLCLYLTLALSIQFEVLHNELNLFSK